MTKTAIEKNYLETIQPFIASAKIGDQVAVQALEQSDELFWKVNNPEIYQLIQQSKI